MLPRSCCFAFTAHPPRGGTGAAGAGEAEKGPQGIPGVPLVTWRKSARAVTASERGCYSSDERAGSSRQGGQPRNSAASQELSAAAAVSAAGPSNAHMALAAQMVLSHPRISPRKVVMLHAGVGWGPSRYRSDWKMLGSITPSTGTGRGMGTAWGCQKEGRHPSMIPTFQKGVLEHQLPPGRTLGMCPEQGPKGGGSKTSAIFSDKQPRPDPRWAPAWSNQDPRPPTKWSRVPQPLTPLRLLMAWK